MGRMLNWSEEKKKKLKRWKINRNKNGKNTESLNVSLSNSIKKVLYKLFQYIFGLYLNCILNICISLIFCQLSFVLFFFFFWVDIQGGGGRRKKKIIKLKNISLDIFVFPHVSAIASQIHLLLVWFHNLGRRRALIHRALRNGVTRLFRFFCLFPFFFILFVCFFYIIDMLIVHLSLLCNGSWMVLIF